MRLDQQNRRSCILLLTLIVALTAFIAWAALGGFSSESLGDDVKADLKGMGPKPVTGAEN